MLDQELFADLRRASAPTIRDESLALAGPPLPDDAPLPDRLPGLDDLPTGFVLEDEDVQEAG